MRSPTTVQSCATGQLTISKTADVSTTTPGSTVHYTITVTNSGSVAYIGANFTDPLTGVIDDAAYNGDASATTGSVSFSSPNLAWTGNLAVGAIATITYSVTVRSPDPGDHVLSNTVTSTTAGSNCASGSTDTRLHGDGQRVRPDDREDRGRQHDHTRIDRAATRSR